MLNKKGYILIVLCFTLGANRTNAQEKGWQKVFNKQNDERYIVYQHAGSIGYHVGGVGRVFWNKKVAAEILHGYVPKYAGGSFHITSAKLMYRAKSYPVKQSLLINPFVFGAMTSFTHGENFYAVWPRDQYEKGYYWWSSAWRFHAFWRIEIQPSIFTNKKSDSVLNRFRVYAEFNTNDLYLYSFLPNWRTIPVRDIFKLGFGIQFILY